MIDRRGVVLMVLILAGCDGRVAPSQAASAAPASTVAAAALTDAERVWCTQNPEPVVDAFGILFDIVDYYNADTYDVMAPIFRGHFGGLQILPVGNPARESLPLDSKFAADVDRACKAAYASR